jgi:hypothetical protein
MLLQAARKRARVPQDAVPQYVRASDEEVDRVVKEVDDYDVMRLPVSASRKEILKRF